MFLYIKFTSSCLILHRTYQSLSGSPKSWTKQEEELEMIPWSLEAELGGNEICQGDRKKEAMVWRGVREKGAEQKLSL